MPAREIRRKDRRLNDEETFEILSAGEYAVLATADAEGQPYAVPLSYVVMNGKIYFHCAREGHKVDNLRANPKACLNVVGFTEPVYDKGFSTYYESVTVFGRLEEITAQPEWEAALTALCEKYLPEAVPGHLAENLARFASRTAVYALAPETITGKAKKKPASAG